MKDCSCCKNFKIKEKKTILENNSWSLEKITESFGALGVLLRIIIVIGFLVWGIGFLFMGHEFVGLLLLVIWIIYISGAKGDDSAMRNPL